MTPATVGGLARRMVDLFWPLAADKAGFAHPDRPPVFLTLETAQYYMAHIVRPLSDQGYFESVTIDRNRLYSQIIDNLNKSAAVGFPFTEIGSRLIRLGLAIRVSGEFIPTRRIAPRASVNFVCKTTCLISLCNSKSSGIIFGLIRLCMIILSKPIVT